MTGSETGMGETGEDDDNTGMTGSETGMGETGNDTGMATGQDTGMGETGNDTGMGDNMDDRDGVEHPDVDVNDLTDKQVLKFMFDAGWKEGINPLEFVEVDYLKQQFEMELSHHYEIEIEAVANLSDALVVDYLFDGFVSDNIDYEFYQKTYSTELEAEYGVSVEELTEVEILEHAYTVGLQQGFELSPIDYNGFLEEYKYEVADYFEIDLAEIAKLDKAELKTFILETASDLKLDVSEYVNIEYYRTELDENIVDNYRVENVYNISYEQTFEFSLEAGVSTSPLIDLEWYREEKATILAENQDAIDMNGDGEIDDVELYDAITGQLLEEGNETSDLYNFEEYFADEAVQSDIVTYYNVESFDELSSTQKLEYMFGQGLLENYDPLSDEFTTENPELQFETFRQANAQILIEFSGSATLEEVTYQNVYNYQAINGLLNPTDANPENIV